MKDALDHAALKTKQRAIRAGFPETMGLRAHRAISWIGRAEACGDDDDARFIFLWIAFTFSGTSDRGLATLCRRVMRPKELGKGKRLSIRTNRLRWMRSTRQFPEASGILTRRRPG